MTDRLRRVLTEVRGLLRAVTVGAWRGVRSRLKDVGQARRLFSRDGFDRFRELPQTLFRLHHRGGLRVVSYSRDGEPIASTLVTRDGDVVSRMSPVLLSQPAIWQGHMERLRQDLAALQQVPALLRSLSGLVTLCLGAVLAAFGFGLVPAMDGGLDAVLARAAELGRELTLPAIGGGLIAGVRYSLGWWLRYQVRRLFA